MGFVCVDSGEMRPLRHIPPKEPGERTLVEVTCRTVQGLFLLKPGGVLNRRLLGCLGKAQRRTSTALHSIEVLSSHLHLLLSVIDAQELSCFMQYFAGNSAREICRLRGWGDRVWGRRYRGIVVSDEEEVQVARLRYHLAQGCKEGLVSSPLEWPGLSTAQALYLGQRELQGDWIDRTGLYRARRRGEDVTERDHLERVPVPLTPLPCWAHQGWEQRRDQARALIADIEQQTRSGHEQAGTRPLGARKVLAMSPLTRPAKLDRSPSPLFHATREARKLLVEAYSRFLAAYRRASRAFRSGQLDAAFPEGSFRPSGGWVPRRARAPD